MRSEELALKSASRVLDACPERSGAAISRSEWRRIGLPSTSSSLGPETQRAWVEVDLGRIAWNTAAMRERAAPGARLLAVVKADAYGHGAEAVAKTTLANGVAWLGVATVEEGLALRSAGIGHPILVMGYVTGAAHIRALFEADLTPSVCSTEHARELALELTEHLAPGAAPVAVHVKLDTGLSRLGQPCSEIRELANAMLDHSRTLRATGIYSHVASADKLDTSGLEEQHAEFERARATLETCGLRPRMVHFANSAAALIAESYHHDLLRLGLAIYGMSPAPHLAVRAPLRPALQVKARVTQIRDLPAGAGVSYGPTFIARQAMRIAVVGIGYADGVSCSLSNRFEVLLRGKRVPQIGRITMDQLMIDVSGVPEVASGDVVTLLGRDGSQEITVMEWARKLATIPWEILCLFKSRLPRVASAADEG